MFDDLTMTQDARECVEDEERFDAAMKRLLLTAHHQRGSMSLIEYHKKRFGKPSEKRGQTYIWNVHRDFGAYRLLVTKTGISFEVPRAMMSSTKTWDVLRQYKATLLGLSTEVRGSVWIDFGLR